MSEAIKDMVSDEREIKAIVTEGFTEHVQCGSIIAYYENGQMAHVPWFAVRNSAGEIMKRINGQFVIEVLYSLGKGNRDD